MKTGLDAVRFGWIAFIIPFLFVFSGTLLMNGSPAMIGIDFAMAAVGVWFGAAGVIGYSFRRLWALDRFVYLLTGLCLLTPLATFGIGRWINGAGVCLAVALLIRERTRRRTRQATGPEQIAADATVHQPRPEHRPTA